MLGALLVQQKQYVGAETPLREGVDFLAKLPPDDWSAFNAKSLLGAALLGQKKLVEAEPLLLEGYEGMQQHAAQIPAAAKQRLVETAQQLVDLYEALDRPEQAARWRTMVETERARLPTGQP
jgi:hypothetical protein